MSYIFNAASQISDKRNFLWIEITPHISLDTRKASSLWSDGPYVLFMSSEHLLVRVSKIIRLPQDSCPTGCKWTLESKLKTTCQGSPPPEEYFNTSAEVSWVTNILKTVIKVNIGHVVFFLFLLKQTKIVHWLRWCDPMKRFLIQVASSSHSFWCILTLLFTLAPGRQVSLSHRRLAPTGGKESDH